MNGPEVVVELAGRTYSRPVARQPLQRLDQRSSSRRGPSSNGSSPVSRESPLNDVISARLRGETAHSADQASFPRKIPSTAGSKRVFGVSLVRQLEEASFPDDASCSAGRGLFRGFLSMIRRMRPFFAKTPSDPGSGPCFPPRSPPIQDPSRVSAMTPLDPGIERLLTEAPI